MTVNVTDLQAGPFVSTGLLQSLPFGFKVFTKEEIELYRVVGGAKVVVDPTDYTFTANTDLAGRRAEGGAVGVTLPAGYDVFVRAVPDFTQAQPWSNQGSRLDNLNEALDRAALRDLALERDKLTTPFPLPGESGFVSVAPDGSPVLLPLASITGIGGDDIFDGGLDGVDGSGDDFDGGYDG